MTLFQWSSEVNEQYMIAWHLLTDSASIVAFAAKVEKAERDPNRVFTGIGEAIEFGVRLIAENAFEGRQLKIDVSGDGRNNIGVSPAIPRQAANALGIVINSLPILTRIVEYSASTTTPAGRSLWVVIKLIPTSITTTWNHTTAKMLPKVRVLSSRLQMIMTTSRVPSCANCSVKFPPWSAKKMLRQERRFKKLMQVS